MFDHFYHQIFRKTVIAFGTLFNGIKINRDGGEIIEVPLAYGPCLLYTSPSPRDKRQSRMPSSA